MKKTKRKRTGRKWIYNPDTFEVRNVKSRSVANEYIEKEGWVFGRKKKQIGKDQVFAMFADVTEMVGFAHW